MKYLLYLVTLSYFLVSCNPKHRAMKRVFKLSEKYDLVDTITIIDYDTLTTNKVQLDTSFVYVPGDTFFYTNDSITVKVITKPSVNNDKDTMYVFAECPPDTIYKKEFIYVERPFVDKWGLMWSTIKVKLKRWWWLLIIGISIGLLVKYGKKYLPL